MTSGYAPAPTARCWPPGQSLPHPHAVPAIAPKGPSQPQTPQGQSKGMERQRVTPGQGKDWLLHADRRCGESCNKVHGMTQTHCIRLPCCNVISMQFLAALFPLVCSSSQLFFLQLLLLEWALESPDFAELLKVVSEIFRRSESSARNLFRCSFSKSCF